MSTVTENDLKRLEDLITKGFDELKQGQENLKKGQDALQTEFALIKGKLSLIEPAFQNLPALTEKIGELKNWKTITVGVIALILGILLRSIYNQP
jgi:hypothetical protein